VPSVLSETARAAQESSVSLSDNKCGNRSCLKRSLSKTANRISCISKSLKLRVPSALLEAVIVGFRRSEAEVSFEES